MKNLKHILLYSSLILLCIASFTDLLTTPAFTFLTSVSEKALLSLEIVADLKLAAGAGSSTNIPLLSGTFESASALLDQGLTHLQWINLMLIGQMILLNLSKSWILKVLLLISLLSLAIAYKHRQLAIKFLLIFLFINPGLPAYVLGVKYMAQQSQIDLGISLHDDLQQIKGRYEKQKTQIKDEMDALKQQQFEEAQAKGKDHLSFFTKVKDFFKEEGMLFKNDLSLVSQEGLAIIRDGSQLLIAKTINLLTQVIFLFVLLPIGYFYLFRTLIKNLSLSQTKEKANTPLKNEPKIQPFKNKKAVTASLIIAGVVTLSVFSFQFFYNNETANPLEKQEASVKAEQTNLKETSTKETVAKPVLGIDVSHFQGDVNWQQIKQAGISYAYAKATQGEKFHDPKFERNWKEAKAAGIYRGAYHFYVVGEDPLKQAESFIKKVGSLESGDLPPMLDLEQGSIPKDFKVEPEELQKNILSWLKHVENKLGVQPLIYTNNPFGNTYLDHPEFANYKLWLAEYGVTKPRLPKTWSSTGWIMWQRSEKGHVEGAVGDVDHDLFNGNLEQLQAMAKK
jgi:lysozyme